MRVYVNFLHLSSSSCSFFFFSHLCFFLNVLDPSRYHPCDNIDPPSLYYSFDGDNLWCSSEPLDRENKGTRRQHSKRSRKWILLHKDEMLSYDTTMGELSLQCLTKSCLKDREARAGVDSVAEMMDEL